ncbi:MAG: Mov34/MPN/PAD-1 family protein [Thermoplasmata archaeon]
MVSKNEQDALPVVLEPYAFSSILVSAIEVHSRESLGFLIGHVDRQFIGGKMTDCLSVHASYPVQSAERGRCMVGFGNIAARQRAMGTVRAVGFELIGGFHSHTEGAPRLSDEDIDAILEEMVEDYSKMGLKKWLEIVVGVERIKKTLALSRLRRRLVKHTNSEVGFFPGNTEPWVVGDIMVNPKLAYRVRMAAYVFDDEKVQETLLCYSRY